MQSSSPLGQAALHVDLLVLIHLAVDQVCFEAPRLVHRRDLPSMIHAARHRDQLMGRSGFPGDVRASVDYYLTIVWLQGSDERNAAAEPVLLLHGKDIVECICFSLALRRELQFCTEPRRKP